MRLPPALRACNPGAGRRLARLCAVELHVDLPVDLPVERRVDLLARRAGPILEPEPPRVLEPEEATVEALRVVAPVEQAGANERRVGCTRRYSDDGSVWRQEGRDHPGQLRVPALRLEHEPPGDDRGLAGARAHRAQAQQLRRNVEGIRAPGEPWAGTQQRREPVLAHQLEQTRQVQLRDPLPPLVAPGDRLVPRPGHVDAQL
jgi:hypothetical protein